jgi:hypothetical protein
MIDQTYQTKESLCDSTVLSYLTPDKQPIETLVAEFERSGLYGALALHVTSTPYRSTASYIIGGYGGWFFNRTFMIGGGGYTLLGSANTTSLQPNEPDVTGFTYAGVVVEYTADSDKLLHWCASTLIGGGNFFGRWRDIASTTINSLTVPFLIVIEPKLCAELNLTSSARLAFGCAYRFIGGGKSNPIAEPSLLSGFSLAVHIKLGMFQ